MHFEVLVEDQSGRIAVDIVLAKILGPNHASHSWRTHGYKGLGRIPKDLDATADPSRRILLAQLPGLLRGYGKSLDPDQSCVVVVVDADRLDCIAFKQELLRILDACNPRPRTLFRIAVEEGEAWLLGDRNAVLTAYPNARRAVLDAYEQDSICGTWEVLAAALMPRRARSKPLGWPESGVAKCRWAETIAPHLDVERNASPSFRAFRDGIRKVAQRG